MGKITTLITGLLLLGMAFTGLTVFISETTTDYGITIEERYADTYAKFNQTTDEFQNLSESLQARVDEPTSTSGILGFVDTLFSGGWSTIKGTYRSVAVAGEMVDATTQVPGIDSNPWITNGIKTIIVFTILLALLSLMMRKDL